MQNKENLLGKNLEQLQQFMAQIKEPQFRAKQILQWIHQNGITDFDAMHTLPKKLRETLKDCAEIKIPEIKETQNCDDGTIKWEIKTSRDGIVEMVLIPSKKRYTLCVSSQAGCIVGCSFCVTGQQGFSHNLTSSEIVGQLWFVHHKYLASLEQKVTNVVFMGMGEPLLNTDAVLASTSIMTHDLAYGLSRKKVTISTSGIVPAIQSLCGKTEVALAVSLHAATDILRQTLVPINKKYPIKAILNACRNYLRSLNGKRFITFEYTIIADTNDSKDHARQLAKLLTDMPCKINIIPYNPSSYFSYKKPSAKVIDEFTEVISKAGFTVTVRKTRGDSKLAACGQLSGAIKAKGGANNLLKTRL